MFSISAADTTPSLLITGVSGFFGGKLAAAAAGKDLHGICCTSRVTIPGCRVHQLDLTGDELESLLDSVRPGTIIHTAAASRPAQVEADPEAARPLNLQSTERLALWCRENSCRLLFTSSDQVYDGTRGGWRESDRALPLNPYGEQKLAAEEIVRELLPELGLVIRVPLLLGPPAFGGTSFSEWIVERLESDEPVPLYRNQVRSAIGGSTLAAAMIRAVKLGLYGVYNGGGAQAVNRLEIGQTLAAVMAKSYSNLQAVSYLPGRSPGGTAPLDISMNSERFWQAVGDERGTLREDLTREYRQ